MKGSGTRRLGFLGNVSFLAGTMMKMAGEKIGPLSMLDPEIVREEKQGGASTPRKKLNKSRRYGVWAQGQGSKYLASRNLKAGHSSSLRKLDKAHRLGHPYEQTPKKIHPKYRHASANASA